jgi:hypothetical protein
VGIEWFAAGLFLECGYSVRKCVLKEKKTEVSR